MDKKNRRKGLSTTPYMIRGMYEWCLDSGFTPYIAVLPGPYAQVPRQYVRKGRIVLDLSPGAVKGLKISNKSIEFSARFDGVSHDIYIPVENVEVIYSAETGKGMGFEVSEPEIEEEAPPEQKPAKKPTLTRIK